MDSVPSRPILKYLGIVILVVVLGIESRRRSRCRYHCMQDQQANAIEERCLKKVGGDPPGLGMRSKKTPSYIAGIKVLHVN